MVNFKSTSGRPFVGREESIKIFKEKYESKFKTGEVVGTDPKPEILAFHGIGGIGKSELAERFINELKENYKETIWSKIDFSGGKIKEGYDGLYRLRNDIGKRFKVKFPIFDYAYTFYFRTEFPHLELKKSTFPLIDESEMLAGAASIAEDIPIVSYLPKAVKIIAKTYKKYKDFETKATYGELQRLQYMKPEAIAKRLPFFFAEDINNFYYEKAKPVVLFFDTFEALRGETRTEISKYEHDEWLRELIRHLPEALFIITGREVLNWEKTETELNKHLEQITIEGFVHKKAMDYLEGSGINNEQIREKIFNGSKGVPFYLALSVDTHEHIIKEGREPHLDDFGNSDIKIFKSFLHNLSENETKTLKILKVPNFWDREIFEMLVKEYNCYSLTDFEEFHRFSFIKYDSVTGTYSLHESMREHLLEFQDRDIKVDKLLYEHYNKKLEDLTEKNATPLHQSAFQEAFHHASEYHNIEDLFNWAVAKLRLFEEAAQYHFLIPVYEKLIKKFEELAGSNDERIAICCNNIGAILDSIGDYKGALENYNKALEIFKIIHVEKHPTVATVYNNIGSVLKAQGDYEGALENYNKALEIDLKVFGDNHPNVATRYNNIGSVLDDQGDYEGALENYNKAQEINLKILGDLHPHTASTYNNIGETLRAQGDYEGALENYNKAQEINLKTLGELHPHTASTYNNIGLVLKAHGDHKGALENYNKALKIDLMVFGDNHPNVAIRYNNIGAVLNAQGDYERALENYNKALKIDLRVFGDDHPDVAIDYNNIALLYYKMGKPQEGLDYARKAYIIFLNFLPPSHPNLNIAKEILIACGGDPSEIERGVLGDS